MTVTDEPSDESRGTAVLYIGTTSSQCGNCRRGTDPYALTHDKILGYRNNGESACGARFTSMASTYVGSDHRLREMRPDLPIYGEPEPLIESTAASSPVVPSVGAVPVEVPEEAEFDFTLTTTIAEAVLNGPGEWIGSGVDLAALASLIREKAKPLIAARVRAEVRQPAANTKDAWFALCHAVATGTDLARENARADYDAAVRAEERQRAEIDVLRRVVADVEAQYPMMREHDALSDWSLGVTWMLDRLTSIADDLAAGSAVPVATPTEPIDEVKCPNCEARIRARMSDQPDNGPTREVANGG